MHAMNHSRRLFTTLLSSLLLLTLSSCALLQPQGSAPLPGGGRWQPLSPALLPVDFDALQRIDFEIGEQRAVWLFSMEKRGDRLALVATTPDGTALFQLQQHGTTVTITPSPLLPPQWKPEIVLMELQLALWPSAAIAANLPPALQWQPTASGFELRRADTVETAIERAADEAWRQPVALTQRRWNYHYRVTPLEFSAP